MTLLDERLRVTQWAWQAVASASGCALAYGAASSLSIYYLFGIYAPDADR